MESVVYHVSTRTVLAISRQTPSVLAFSKIIQADSYTATHLITRKKEEAMVVYRLARASPLMQTPERGQPLAVAAGADGPSHEPNVGRGQPHFQELERCWPCWRSPRMTSVCRGSRSLKYANTEPGHRSTAASHGAALWEVNNDKRPS